MERHLQHMPRLSPLMHPMQTAFFPPESDAVLKPGAKSPTCMCSSSCWAKLRRIITGLPPPLTGEYDADTQSAVRHAQKIFQLPETGITDRATWRR